MMTMTVRRRPDWIPNRQDLPAPHERRVWPPEGFGGAFDPYWGHKKKMSKKARLRLREYHHVLTRRKDGKVEVVMSTDVLQGNGRRNTMARKCRKAGSCWVTYATSGVNEEFENASLERRVAPWSPHLAEP